MASKYHKITGNESIGTIAGMYGVDPQTLLKANPNMMSAVSGAYMKIPPPLTTAPTSFVGSEPSLIPNAPRYAPTGSFLANAGQTALAVDQSSSQGTRRDTRGSTPTPAGYSSGTFLSGAGVPRTPQAIQTGGLLSGDKQGLTPPPSAPTVTASSRAAGRSQFLSGQGINPNSGYIPTRSDVWNMKANARRRRAAEAGYEDGGAGNNGSVVSPSAGSNLANNFGNVASVWRIG